MKNKFNFPQIFLYMLSFILLSCQSSYDDTNVNEEKKSLSKKMGQLSIGEIHNELLTYTYTEYQPLDDLNSLEDKLTDLANFQSEYLQSFDNSSVDMNYAISHINDVKEFYLLENSMDLFLNGIEINRNIKTLHEMNEYLLEVGAISNFDKSIVDDVLISLDNNLNGELSNKELYNKLLVHKDNWVESQSNAINKGADFSFIILDIGINSLEWWENNPNAPIMQTNALPAWIATDIVGAIGGAGLAAISQHILNDGKINWKLVAAAGLTTAITASTGVFGKIGKWLVKK